MRCAVESGSSTVHAHRSAGGVQLGGSYEMCEFLRDPGSAPAHLCIDEVDSAVDDEEWVFSVDSRGDDGDAIEVLGP